MQGSGCRVQGSGCRVQGSGFRVQGEGYRVFGDQGLDGEERWGFRVYDAGCGLGVEGAGLRVES